MSTQLYLKGYKRVANVPTRTSDFLRVLHSRAAGEDVPAGADEFDKDEKTHAAECRVMTDGVA